MIFRDSSFHKTEDVIKWFAKHPRFKLQFTPTSPSWLNAVENWFTKLERQALDRDVFCSAKDFHRFIKTHN
jgi:transposase